MTFFYAWCGVKLFGVEKKMWMSLFYAIVWSLWNIRKKVAFESLNHIGNSK